MPLNVVAKNNAVNPFQFVRTAGDTRVASSVASLEFSGTDGTPEQISLAAEQPSIRVTIPVSVSGSACRRTVGGCRYFNETTQTWETDGLFEVERTDTYIVCEAKHLTSFAISADDALPAFNVVDPIGDADLLTNITLENSLVFWVVGIILVSFGSLMILGARQDQRDRAKARLEGQLNRMERRILNPDKRLVDEVHDRKAGMLGRVVKLHRAKNGAAGPASQEDDGYLPKMGKALVDQHPVVSVLYTRPSDHFTRPQRLAVLLALILGQIAVVALFFGTDPSNLAAKAFIGIITAIALSPSKVTHSHALALLPPL